MGRSSIPRVFKVASLQCLYIISKKKWDSWFLFWFEVDFLHADKHKQIGIIFFDGSGQACPKYPKSEVGYIIFVISFWKKVLCSAVMESIQIFYVDPVIFIVTCFFVSKNLIRSLESIRISLDTFFSKILSYFWFES